MQINEKKKIAEDSDKYFLSIIQLNDYELLFFLCLHSFLSTTNSSLRIRKIRSIALSKYFFFAKDTPDTVKLFGKIYEDLFFP